ncbi:MAG: hypothetical protein KC561_21320, partial [Myxococcales bacterium]|nr:hypothetical protein [Myxococcales bacterium]
NHTIEVDTTRPVSVTVMSSGDPTLVVRGPGGIFCDDDTNGLQPALVGEVLRAGTYEVFVGTYTQAAPNTAYNITFSAD